MSLYDHAADLAPPWVEGDDEWESMIERARALDARGINPFERERGERG